MRRRHIRYNKYDLRIRLVVKPSVKLFRRIYVYLPAGETRIHKRLLLLVRASSGPRGEKSDGSVVSKNFLDFIRTYVEETRYGAEEKDVQSL